MARRDYDGSHINEAAGISGFGGHPLEELAGDASRSAAAGATDLASFGIEDAEQLVAVAAVPDVREELESVLGMKNKDLQALLARAESALPPQRAEMMKTPAPKDLGLGVLQPTAEMMAAIETSARDFAAELEAVALPPAINLIGYMPAMRNQQSRGTCVAFTLTALNEYILRRRNISRDLSEQHLYHETKLIDGASASCGTWQARAVTVLRDRGQCREVIWPYNPNPLCNNHGARPASARPDGLNNRLSTLAVSTRSVMDYKTNMSKQRPVTLSIPVYNSWYQSAETRRSGRITMRIGNEPSVGGHAVCLVGYQDSASSPGGGYFIVRNSWGTTWAYQSPYGAGYGTIPYQYIANDAWEAFTAVVPGVGKGEGEQPDVESSAAETTITIDVSPNIKITITSGGQGTSA